MLSFRTHRISTIPVNADTTWLLQLPLPEPTSSRRWYNILFDPWLSGPQSDIASWFSKQWHAIPPALGSISEVETLCDEVERLSAGPQRNSAPPAVGSPLIDTIAISHEFTDHCHQGTLLQCAPSIPVFAATKAVDLVRSWKHFTTVVELPAFGIGADWRTMSMSPLPSWLSITRLVTSRDALYYHSAVMVAFALGQSDAEVESVIYTPHGIHAPSLSVVATASPAIKTLAFMHGLHDVWLDWGQQLNLGAHNGLKAQQAINARYWIGTHDEIKRGGGVVSWFLRRKVYTLLDALKKAAKDGKESTGKDMLGGGEFMELTNGESKTLV
jgi:hypothetical protein